MVVVMAIKQHMCQTHNTSVLHTTAGLHWVSDAHKSTDGGVRVVRLGWNLGQILNKWTINLGHFKISFQYIFLGEPKCTEN